MDDKIKDIKELKMRDSYAKRLREFRPDERLISREGTIHGTSLRTDMITVDIKNVIRVWEFKVTADYSALGQLLVYLHLKRKETEFKKSVIGVLAVTEISEYIKEVIISSGLNIEIVLLNKSISGIEKYLIGNEVNVNYPHYFSN
ncbi:MULTISPECIES: hypothetical protein [unclassified Photobacterium]|uniref:hypothetical protein n=1 Tax=unclassified Photobacterium TaxID=2628852 RepID=UPI001EE14479|nr:MULTISPECIES: hypothetical protein [unclassified Photobacterium]MCG3865810.1 hypothetical protein [Photobacterium sp. Ph6]MCG3877285.1 hypothetical protein [Photobacterium sp. Ph5]